MSHIADVVGLDEMSGPGAAVLCTTDVSHAAERLAVSAPSAVIAVAVEDDAGVCQAVFEATLFPASRIVGCGPAGDGMAEAACRVVEAALLGKRHEIDCTLMRDGRFEAHRAELGPRGVARVLD